MTGALTQSSTWILLFLLMARGVVIGGGGVIGPSPASVIAERSTAHAAHHKRLSAGERKPYFGRFSLFAAFCESSKKSSTYRRPPSPQKSHYGSAASWGQPVIRLKTLRRRRRVRHCRTRRALCVFFLSFFFKSRSRSHFSSHSSHPEHDVNQLYLEISSLEVHWYGSAPWTGSHNNSGRSRRD